MPRYEKGYTNATTKGYPRITAGPLRNEYLHRVIAAAMLGRDLKKDEQVHHRDGNKLNFDFRNLVVMGEADHGWVSAKQAWYMKRKEEQDKAEWDAYMASLPADCSEREIKKEWENGSYKK